VDFPVSIPQLTSCLHADRAILPINFRMLLRSFSIPRAYLRPIEPTVPILLVSLQIERAEGDRMATIPVEQIKRNRHGPGGLKHISVPSTNGICARADVRCFSWGGRT
jgi:hypothetical protein